MRTAKTQTTDRAFLFTGEIDSRRSIELNKIIDSMVDADYQIFDLRRCTEMQTPASIYILFGKKYRLSQWNAASGSC